MQVTSEPILSIPASRLREVSSLLRACVSVATTTPSGAAVCVPERPLESCIENLDPSSERSVAANLPWRPQPASDPPTCHHVAHVGPCREREREPQRSSKSEEAASGWHRGRSGRLLADELVPIRRRYEHERAAHRPTPRRVLDANHRCRRRAGDGNDSSELPDLDRIGVVEHCQQPNTVALAWSAADCFDS